MPVTIKPYVNFQRNEPKLFLVTIVIDSHVSWEFCIDMLMKIFHKSRTDAELLTQEIQTVGEALCGGYNYEVAESKAVNVEEMAKDKGFSICCLVEQV